MYTNGWNNGPIENQTLPLFLYYSVLPADKRKAAKTITVFKTLEKQLA